MKCLHCDYEHGPFSPCIMTTSLDEEIERRERTGKRIDLNEHAAAMELPDEPEDNEEDEEED